MKGLVKSPNELISEIKVKIPKYVLKAFEDEIKKHWDGERARVQEFNVVHRIIDASPDKITKYDICDRKWLDVDDIFRANGWHVAYYIPIFSKDEGPYFVFTK